MEIFIDENEKLKKSFDRIDMEADPVKALLEMLSVNFKGINSNPILKEWYNRDLFSKLEKQFYEQGGIKNIAEFMNTGITGMIKKWKAEGKMVNDLDDDMILAILNSIPYIDIHKEEIGLKYFPRILYHITELILKGLTSC
jgi:hypothetical protein